MEKIKRIAMIAHDNRKKAKDYGKYIDRDLEKN